MTWTWLIILSALGYAQRTIPWAMSARFNLPGKVTVWLRYVGPAAFATLLVTDITKVTMPALLSLAVAGFISWRTRNLGLAVLAALAVNIAAQAITLINA